MMQRRRRLHGRRGLKCRSYVCRRNIYMSPPSRAAWIEISSALPSATGTASPPSRAAWIEMAKSCRRSFCAERRRLHGRRGLKSDLREGCCAFMSRRLHGRRGLKYLAFLIRNGG